MYNAEPCRGAYLNIILSYAGVTIYIYCNAELCRDADLCIMLSCAGGADLYIMLSGAGMLIYV
jgi:hypothetical protein